jgi:hypothetical protein
MHDSIVGIALERAAREAPGHPRVECVVHAQVRQSRRDELKLVDLSAERSCDALTGVS